MSNRSKKALTCLATALSVIMLSTGLGAAEDGPQMKMDPRFMEMLSSYQKAVETTEKNLDQACSKVKSDDPGALACLQRQVLKDSLSSSQKKSSETTNKTVK
jgi:hypothetical protein